MEKSNIVKVIPSNISWSDVGSFDSLPKDENSNDSKNNLVYGVERKIATVDLIIIDALLISKKGSSQKIKQDIDHGEAIQY